MSKYFLNNCRIFSAIAPCIALPPTSLWSYAGNKALFSFFTAVLAQNISWKLQLQVLKTGLQSYYNFQPGTVTED